MQLIIRVLVVNSIILLIQGVPNLIQVFPEEPVTLVLLGGGVFGHWIQVRREG